jgi:hypothetical protein
MSLCLRIATPEDSHQLWQWRNDPVTRANSKTNEQVPFERHES